MEMSSDPILEAYTSRKIIIELDYGHFLTPAGWLNLIQIVSIDKRLGIWGPLEIDKFLYFLYIHHSYILGLLFPVAVLLWISYDNKSRLLCCYN